MSWKESGINKWLSSLSCHVRNKMHYISLNFWDEKTFSCNLILYFSTKNWHSLPRHQKQLLLRLRVIKKDVLWLNFDPSFSGILMDLLFDLIYESVSIEWLAESTANFFGYIKNYYLKMLKNITIIWGQGTRRYILNWV